MSHHPLLPSQIDPHAALLLVCLPYAGGGGAAFYRWRRFLPPEIELIPLRLPGREGRFGDPFYSSLPVLARDAADAIEQFSNRPFVLLGHSLGAYAALEIARELRRRNSALPRLLVVTASPAPHLARSQSPISHLPDDQFIAEIVRRFEGVPESIRAYKGLLDLMLPALRADILMLEQYIPLAEPPLDVEILAMGGAEDPGISITDLQAWREYTTGRCSTRLFPGGHFFPFRDQEEGSGAAVPNLIGLQTIIDRLRKVMESQ